MWSENKTIQFVIFLHAYSTAQRAIITQARVKRQNKKQNTYKQMTKHGNLYHLDSKIQLVQSRQPLYSKDIYKSLMQLIFL
jgi:hypothetical protein